MPTFIATGVLTPGAPGRTVRVCESFDFRWLIEDMFANVQLSDRGDAQGPRAG